MGKDLKTTLYRKDWFLTYRNEKGQDTSLGIHNGLFGTQGHMKSISHPIRIEKQLNRQ